MKTYAILNDIQIPFEDKPVLEAVIKFVDTIQPDGIILNGDVVDCYSLSVFSKNPIQDATLDVEIERAEGLMFRLRAKEMIWIGGNHEDRLRKYLWDRAPALHGVNEFQKVFKLNSYGYKWIPYGGGVDLGKLHVTHGEMVRTHSAYSAKAHYDRLGQSVLIGHTHRLGSYFRTTMAGPHVAYENGCLCRMDPEYVKHPDWQQGFSVVHVDPKTRFFNVQQIPILDGKVFYYGGTKVEVVR